jgi:hypothetical protein
MSVFPVHLSLWRLPVVINLATVTKRLTISLLLCLLALAIVSNRLVSLRQIAIAADSATNVHEPLDNIIRPGFTGKFLVPETLQDELHLQKLAPTSLKIAANVFSNSWRLSRLEIDTSPKPPSYILLLVLNL